MDCHIETFREGYDGCNVRAEVIHTATGRQLYVTWPYRSERAARDRARRWIREEYRKNETLELFEQDVSYPSKDSYLPQRPLRARPEGSHKDTKKGTA